MVTLVMAGVMAGFGELGTWVMIVGLNSDSGIRGQLGCALR